VAKGTAVVTGASSGIGAVYADRLAKRGYDLILVARRGDKLNALADRLKRETAANVETVVADLGRTADLNRVETLVASNPNITLLVNNAGTATWGPAAAADASAQDAMIALNVTALTRLSLAAFRKFIERDNGAIVNVSSVLALHTAPFSSIYSGTKGYVLNFTRGLQQEAGNSKVKVQLVFPGATGTDIWDNGGFALKNLDPATVMSVDDLVDASLAGLDHGETITFPSVEDTAFWDKYDSARLALFRASQNGKVAARYAVRAAVLA
jgi:short-subunit dehydrogenase